VAWSGVEYMLERCAAEGMTADVIELLKARVSNNSLMII
jgi:hypothetical protein